MIEEIQAELERIYVLRPLLAIRWIEGSLGVVPTEFELLVDRAVDAPGLKSEIGQLVAAKRRGEELDRGPRLESISGFIESELARLESVEFGREYGESMGPIQEYNRVFRAALEEVWS